MSEAASSVSVVSETKVQRSARVVADELLAAVNTQRLAELEQLRLVGELVDCYDHVETPLIEGAARLVPSGGDGTPAVDEFLVKELAPLLRLSEANAWQLIRDAVNLRDRHPQTWCSLLLGQGQVWHARQIARACADLPLEAALWVDDRVGPALGQLPWARLQRKLAGHVVTADKDLAAAKRARARKERFVQIRHTGQGTSWLVALLSTPDAVALDKAIQAISHDLLGDGTYPGTPDEARAEALGILATPTSTQASSGVTGRQLDDALTLPADTAIPNAGTSVGDPSGPPILRPRSRLPRPEATLVIHVSHDTLAQWTQPPVPPRAAGPRLGPPGALGPTEPHDHNKLDENSTGDVQITRGLRGPIATPHRQRRRRLRLTGPPGIARPDGPAGLNTLGPLLVDQVRQLLGHAHIRVLPVIDLNDDPAVDAYEIPDKIRTHITLRDHHSVFPYATRIATGCDLDHTDPYRVDADEHVPAGQTRASNLGPLDRSSHRAKTHAGWQLTQPTPGTFDWTSPLGYTYCVDHQGSGPRSTTTEETYQFDPDLTRDRQPGS